MPDDLTKITERFGQLSKDAGTLSARLDLARGITEGVDWLVDRLDAIVDNAFELDELVRAEIAAASGRRLRAARQAAEEAAERVRREEARRPPDLATNRERREAARARRDATRAELAQERSAIATERRGIIDRARQEGAR